MLPLPAPPAIRVAVVQDRTSTSRATGGFLDVRRLDLVAHFPDGTVSEPFPYDIAERRALDAVVIAAYEACDAGTGAGVRVHLRSAVRPACALRVQPPHHDGALWELPAGLVEPGEEPAAAAVRELHEELGVSVAVGAMRALGEWTFPAPGMIAERHLFFAVDVTGARREAPLEDGSALERAAALIALPLGDAIEHCRRGAIRDAKTELALRRLAEMTG